MLGTTPARTAWTEAAGVLALRSRVREVAFLDFTIDGIALRVLVNGHRETPGAVGERTRLRDERPDGAIEQLRRLLGDAPGDFDDGRVALLVCQLCEDLGCRALSAQLVITGEHVEWRELGWQVDYEPFAVDPASFTPALTLRFDRAAYTNTVKALLEHFDDVSAATAPANAGNTSPRN